MRNIISCSPSILSKKVEEISIANLPKTYSLYYSISKSNISKSENRYLPKPNSSIMP